ncbi:MAG: acyl-CoA desaturase [Salinisphaera sp.]|jgi:stearoyl-CoA desaturase (delta-9 desaturase)|nr:acyl-CoA desaturase [Salinisphaera sp.]
MTPDTDNLFPDDAADATPERTRGVDLVFAAIVTFAPPAAFVLGTWLWISGRAVPSAVEIGTMIAIHVCSLVGVELGFHRLFSHRSYTATRLVKVGLAAMGSLAFQGPVIWWASIHRKHHRYADQPGDPHSMYLFDPDRRFTWRGAIHAHIGWVWSARSVGRGGFARYAKDLYRDADLLWIHTHYFAFMIAGFALPALISGVAHGSLQGAGLGLLWGGFIRIFLMNHLTYWCINSVTHGWGRQDYATPDHSTNVPLLALVTLGQSWHNNHHASPTSAIMSHRKGQLDPGAWILALLERGKLISNVRRPYGPALGRVRRGQTRNVAPPHHGDDH